MICCWARVASLFRITVFRQKGMLSSSIKVLKGLCFVVIVICRQIVLWGNDGIYFDLLGPNFIRGR
ncbi:MAG: hypothetical protein ACI90V_006536 [Bacillariaceae sp.]|jgi:hypothetical protein